MKRYLTNTTTCRLDVLFEDIDDYKHLDLGTYCDVCVSKCKCGSCGSRRAPLQFFSEKLGYAIIRKDAHD